MVVPTVNREEFERRNEGIDRTKGRTRKQSITAAAAWKLVIQLVVN